MRTFGFSTLLALFAIFAVPSESQVQWIQTNGLFGGYVVSLAVSGTNLFAGTSVGVFRLATGVYYYRLSAGEYVQIKKSILVMGTGTFVA